MSGKPFNLGSLVRNNPHPPSAAATRCSQLVIVDNSNPASRSYTAVGSGTRITSEPGKTASRVGQSHRITQTDWRDAALLSRQVAAGGLIACGPHRGHPCPGLDCLDGA